MTPKQIEQFFFTTINQKREFGFALYNEIENVTEDQIYNWRKKRTKPSLGDMLNLLYQLGLIDVSTDLFDDEN